VLDGVRHQFRQTRHRIGGQGPAVEEAAQPPARMTDQARIMGKSW
jgi:hypothetical protein